MSVLSRLRELVAGRPTVPRDPVTYRPIGVVRNHVHEPRTSGWHDVSSDIILTEDLSDALDGLDGFSHAIVVFHLNRVPDDEKRRIHLTIGENPGTEVGLFATRSPLRPNAIGLAVVRVVHRRKNVIRVRGLDALDGTPVLDLKPYLPPYDSVPEAALPAWAVSPPPGV